MRKVFLSVALAITLVFPGILFSQTSNTPNRETLQEAQPRDFPPDSAIDGPGGNKNWGAPGVFQGPPPGGLPGKLGRRPPRGDPQDFRKNFKGPQDPEFKERKERITAIRSTAEAYKHLSELYSQQGKVDEAVEQLRKIIELASVSDERDGMVISKYMSQVYLEMADVYMRKNRTEDAEKVLNEGIEKTRTFDVEMSSRLALQLGKIQEKAGKFSDAEKTFKRIIEINAGKLKK